MYKWTMVGLLMILVGMLCCALAQGQNCNDDCRDRLKFWNGTNYTDCTLEDCFMCANAGRCRPAFDGCPLCTCEPHGQMQVIEIYDDGEYICDTVTTRNVGEATIPAGATLLGGGPTTYYYCEF